MSLKMLINARQSEECRIALVENDVLEDLYVERTTNDNYVGNIYKGVVVNIEQSLQAVFVDFGVGHNGFLHISDVEPHYFKQASNFTPREEERRGANGRRRADHDDDYADFGRPKFKPPIQEVFQKGDEVLVQVIKEGIGTKGPTLSTYISIPGRYLVLMPKLGRVGVSRKIEDEGVRRKLRSLMLELNPPKGLGFIVRTAGSDRTRKELALDLAYLMRLWKSIVRRVKNLPGPVGVYEESDITIRTVRDVFTSSVEEIVVDEKDTYDRVSEFLKTIMPRYADRIRYYSDREPLFTKYGVDREIAKINSRKVALKDGGSFVLAANSPFGPCVHFLYDKWGHSAPGGMMWSGCYTKGKNMAHAVVFAEHTVKGMRDPWYIDEHSGAEYVKTWNDALRILDDGTPKKVVLYPNAECQVLDNSKQFYKQGK